MNFVEKVNGLSSISDWNGSAWVTNSERRYLYFGWNLVAEFEATGTFALTRSYTWGLDATESLTATGGIGALLQVHDQSSSADYLPTYDSNGNVSALVDASGNVAALYEYSAYGELLRCEGTYARANPFRFSTKFMDDETGLDYYGQRFYRPSLGRFINRDPIGEAGGTNLYGFVNNSPTNAWDVLGNSCIWRDVGGTMVLTCSRHSGDNSDDPFSSSTNTFDFGHFSGWGGSNFTLDFQYNQSVSGSSSLTPPSVPKAPKKTKNAPLDWLKKLCGSEAGRQLVSYLNAGKYNVFDVDWKINGLSEYTSGNNTYLTSGFGDGPSGGNDIFLFSVNASPITSAIANNRRFNYSGSVTDLQVSTLVHETLHFTNPTASEAQVWYLTDQNLGRYNLPVLFGLPNARAYGGLVNPAHGYNGVQASTQSGSSNISISKNDLNDLKNQAAQYGGWDCSRVK